MRTGCNSKASLMARGKSEGSGSTRAKINPFASREPWLLISVSRRSFRLHLLRWYDREKRSLPWRGESDPYRILVSEIMLQQTRVAVVKDRYTAFLRRFPDVPRLARASEDSVLAEWSGLGYYRRARNLHAAAKEIHRQSVFPSTAASLAELPGIGLYTAAAVASIAFGEPVAVVDGNVKRVLRRLTGSVLSDRACREAAQALLEERRPGDFNQALMELGAVVCLPGEPACDACPVLRFCASSDSTLKSTVVKREIPDRKKATLSCLLAKKNGAVLLELRQAQVSLMPGMWELPQLKTAATEAGEPIITVKHSITITDYIVSVYASKPAKDIHGSWIPLDEVQTLPLTGLTRKILARLNLIR
jgi:A/G-specific adenine glycosylase